MMQHSISARLALCLVPWLLCFDMARAQPWRPSSELPDAAAYGVHLEMRDLPQVRAWLDAGLDPDFMADRIGSGLMFSAWFGDIPMMELLVARGADVNKANALGESALMHAAWRGQLEAVKWLLAKGARVNNEPMRWSALHYAVFAGHWEVANHLLLRGADINARSTNGSSVLMMAVYEGHEPIVRRLLARGADPAIRNDRGDGALEWAFKFRRLVIARLVADPSEFALAANRPRTDWGAAQRSQPAANPPSEEAAAQDQRPPVSEFAGKIDELERMRDTLAARGLADAVKKMDTRISALRAQRARAEREDTPAAVLEISARRAAPEDQNMRIIFGTDGAAP
jgi:ankyrin repeat protein